MEFISYNASVSKVDARGVKGAILEACTQIDTTVWSLIEAEVETHSLHADEYTTVYIMCDFTSKIEDELEKNGVAVVMCTSILPERKSHVYVVLH